jgi:Tol biopolymer transport system component
MHDVDTAHRTVAARTTAGGLALPHAALAIALVVRLLVPVTAEAETRKQCLRACKPAIDLCVAGGAARRVCKRDLVRQCRTGGVAVCQSTTTTTSTSSTTTTLPPPPTNLRIASRSDGPPAFDLRWNGAPDVAAFVVYESATAFTTPDDAAIAAVVPGPAPSAEIAIRTGTGERHFRASAVDFDGVESVLSDELVVDTTPRLVFQADKVTNDVFELWSVVAGSGAEPTNVSGTLVAGGDVDRFFLSPDGRRVVFSADKDTDNLIELYVAPLDGSTAPVKVSGPLVAGGAPQPFLVAWSPDGSKLAFTGDLRTDEVFELFVAPADGSTPPVAVSGTLVTGGDVALDGFAWSPDGTRLAFVADKQTDGTNELFVVPADGVTEPIEVSGTLVAGGQVQGFAWAPDGTRLAMLASKDTVGLNEIFVGTADGASEPTKVSGVLAPFASLNSRPLWSPDSTRIAFSGDLLTNAVFEVFVTRADGLGVPLRVSGQSQAFSDIVSFRWSPDATRLVFNMDKNADNADEVFVVGAGGGEEPTRVTGPFVTDREAFNPQWSPRGDRVAYFADANVDQQFELFVADPFVADGAIEVSGPILAGADVFQYAWSPDGQRLAIVGSLETTTVSELFVTSPTGGPPVKVSGAMAAGGGVNGTFFGWSPLSN